MVSADFFTGPFWKLTFFPSLQFQYFSFSAKDFKIFNITANMTNMTAKVGNPIYMDRSRTEHAGYNNCCLILTSRSLNRLSLNEF